VQVRVIKDCSKKIGERLRNLSTKTGGKNICELGNLFYSVSRATRRGARTGTFKFFLVERTCPRNSHASTP
jgi:hypothetical protein